MERRECPECRRKREAEEAVKVTEGLELPEPEGSEKQVARANCIRAGFAGEINPDEKYRNGNPMKVLKSVTSAKTSIGNRDSTLYGFLTDILRRNPALMDRFNSRRKIKYTMLRPENPNPARPGFQGMGLTMILTGMARNLSNPPPSLPTMRKPALSAEEKMENARLLFFTAGWAKRRQTGWRRWCAIN